MPPMQQKFMSQGAHNASGNCVIIFRFSHKHETPQSREEVLLTFCDLFHVFFLTKKYM